MPLRAHIVKPDGGLVETGRDGVEKDAQGDPGVPPDPEGVGHCIGIDAQHVAERVRDRALVDVKGPGLVKKAFHVS